MSAPVIAALFAEVVARYPHRLAIASVGRRLSYRELDEAVGRLTLALDAAGADSGPIALALRHGVPLAVGLLGVLRLGRVAVPLDPALPPLRRERIVDRAGATLVVAEDGTDFRITRIAEPRDTLHHPGVTAPDAVAMLLYTSGSTGAPKGVVYSQRGIVERIVRRDRFALGPGDAVGIFGPAGMSVFRTLLRGAALLSWDLARDGKAGIAAWLEREEITVLHGTPTLFRELGEELAGRRAFPRLRCVSVTGEPLLWRDVDTLRRLFPAPCLLLNGLGTTEAGTFCQWTIDGASARDGATVPVGSAVEGMAIVLRGADGVPVAPGQIGEIVVCGELLASGYWNEATLEVSRFGRDPQRPEVRTCATGDLGRVLPSGALLHLGRRDRQLEVRGVRVEPSEVEAALLEHPEIRAAVVGGHRDDDGTQRVAAWLVVRERRPGLVRELVRFSRERLADAMVPDAWSFLDALPMLVNGKVDQRALPEPPPQRGPRRDAGILELLARQVTAHPDATAYHDDAGLLTYGELDRRSALLAGVLRARGVTGEAVVALALERTRSFAIAMLAVLRAGGACLPLDPHGPRMRNAAMLSASGARWLLARAGEQIDDGCDLVRLDPDAPIASAPEVPPASFDPDRLAFVLYTSGSSGPAKGVEINEGQVLHRLAWDWTARPFVSGEVACQRGAMGFVDSLAEWLGPLLQGVPTVLLGDDVLRRPRALVDALAAVRVSRILLVPSQLELLLDTVDDLGARLPALRLWTCSGEPLSRHTADRFRRDVPGAVLWNVYGATEAWDCTCHRLDDDEAVIPIGRPLPGMRVYVLDEKLTPVPIGVAGDLYVAGAGLARGYRGDEALTRERFVPNPFTPEVGDRLYRTGDRARRRDDGVLEHHGRSDRRVKLLGVRIELGEIEAALASHPGVREAAALQVGRRIVAYVAAQQRAVLDLAELRAHVQQRLPAAAVPREIVVRAALPRDARGKIDHGALDGAARVPRVASPARAAGRPTELEQTLVQVFADLLGRSDVGVEDDFFDLGGDSLLAVRLVAEVEDMTGTTLPLDAIAVASTARGLAAALTEGGFAWASGGCITQHPQGSAPPLFGVCGAWGYAVRLLRLGRALGADVPLHALQPPGMAWPPRFDLGAIAAHYVGEILRRQPSGPYRLIGTSVGGVIAFEMAMQLEAGGHEVASLAMVDSALPGARLKPLPAVDESQSSPIERAGRRVYAAHRRALAGYRPRALLAGALVYFLCAEAAHDSHVGWQRHARQRIEVVPVAGSHGAFHVEPQLGMITRRLRAILGSDEGFVTG